MAISYFIEFLSLQSCLIFGVVFLVVYRVLSKDKYARLPPGPSSLPIIGNVHKIGGSQMHIVTAKMADEFGSVITLNLAGTKIVLLTDLRAIKEAFIDRADCFSDRFQHPLTEIVNGNTGSLVMENGNGWKINRRKTLTALRNFGMGKRSLENRINEEGRYLSECFDDYDGRPFDPQRLVQNAVANVICSISFGNRFDYDDQEFKELLDYIQVFFQKLSGPSLVSNFPRLWYTRLYKTLREQNDKCVEFLRRIVNQHRASFDSNDIRDIIDVHLSANENSEDHKSALPTNLIWRGLFDLFTAGTDTTSNTILWSILILTQYPDVQEKVQNEIDAVIGKERPPTLPDRVNMPYLDATLMEVQRFRPVACFIPPRVASVDTEFRGFTIPKGTSVWANLYAVLHSEKHWENPDHFQPERFLSNDGQETIKPEAFIPFGVGRRVCLGEQLARMELFLLVANLLQRFTFKLPEEDPKPNLAGDHGITLSPCRFRILAIKR